MGEEFQMLSIYIVNVWEVRKHDVYVHVCVHACAHVHVSLPIAMGVWSIALWLWRLFEYLSNHVLQLFIL